MRRISRFASAGVVVLAIIAAFSFWAVPYFTGGPALIVHHAPRLYERRAGALTANITGEVSSIVDAIEYRLNVGRWRPAGRGQPRVPDDQFVIELRPEELANGVNRLEIRVIDGKTPVAIKEHMFKYDAGAIALPRKVEWGGADLDVQDGVWEIVTIDGERRVRTKPGYEGYDRLLLVTGAFPGGRRVETDLVVEAKTGADIGKPFGVGLLPLWGGHLEKKDSAKPIVPRRGWLYGIAWFYSLGRGVGLEFALKVGGDLNNWIHSYRKYKIEEKTKYRIVAEVLEVVDQEGRHVAYRQRMKWWRDGQPESNRWQTLEDAAGVSIPTGEYAVALVAHRVRAHFGAVQVTPLPPIIAVQAKPTRR